MRLGINASIHLQRQTYFQTLKRWALVPILVLIALTVVLAALQINIPIGSPLLPRILNLLFISVICFAGTYLAVRVFVATGSRQVLIFGSGLLALGMANILGG